MSDIEQTRPEVETIKDIQPGPKGGLPPTKGHTNNPHGKPKGLRNKLSTKLILDAIYSRTGQNFSELLADGYVNTINSDDRRLRLEYEKILLNKCVADKVDVDITTDGESLNQRQEAFLAVIEKLRQREKDGYYAPDKIQEQASTPTKH